MIRNEMQPSQTKTVTFNPVVSVTSANPVGTTENANNTNTSGGTGSGGVSLALAGTNSGLMTSSAFASASGSAVPASVTPTYSGVSLENAQSSIQILHAPAPSVPASVGTASSCSHHVGAMVGGPSMSMANVANTTVTSNPASSLPQGGPLPLQTQMNYRQLQDMLNKLTLDVQEQEQLFFNEAMKINAWDKTLIMNGQKIIKMNSTVEALKISHGRVEAAVGYLKSQQVEMERTLNALESSIPDTISDLDLPERTHLSELATSVKNQLMQMGDDLKTVILTVNEWNSPAANAHSKDPMVQILKILNEHMDALQFVDESAHELKIALVDLRGQHKDAKKSHLAALRYGHGPL